MASLFFREFNQQWYCQIGKRQVRLGPDKDEAERRYHTLMLDPTDTDPVVADIAERFLEWLKANRDEKTYNYYAPYVNGFVNEIGFSARVSKVRPITLSTWADEAMADFSSRLNFA